MAKDEKVLNQAYDWTAEKEPELTLTHRKATRYPGWSAGELPSITELDQVKELPEEFKEIVGTIIDKARELQGKLDPMETRLAEISAETKRLNDQAKKVREAGEKEIQPLVNKFYEDVKIKTPQLGNSAFGAMKEVGIATAKWQEKNMLLGVKVAILQTIELGPDAEKTLQLIRDYLTIHHPKILKELDGFLTLCKETTQKEIAPKVLVKDLNEHKMLNNIMFRYLQKEHSGLYKKALLSEAKTMNDVYKLTNLDYIKEDIKEHRKKVEKVLRFRLLKETGLMDFFSSLKNRIVKFFGNLNLISKQGPIIANDIEKDCNNLDILIKLADGDIDYDFAKRMLGTR